MRALRVIAATVVAAAMVWLALAYRDRERREHTEAAAAAMRALGTMQLAPAGAAPEAGISARAPLDVRPIPQTLMTQLHKSADFQRLHHRCGACHAIPDPALHTTEEWIAVVARMSVLIDSAGLLPLSDNDRSAVLRVLSAHARL